MMFASKNPRDLPWHPGQTVDVYDVSVNGEPAKMVVRDYPQHNPPNPILAAFRASTFSAKGILWAIEKGASRPNDKRSKAIRSWVEMGFTQMKPYEGEWIITGRSALRHGELGNAISALAHARRVLQKLANLAEMEN